MLPLAEAVEAAAVALAEHSLALSRPRPIRITAFTSNFSPRATRIFSAFSALHPEIQFEFLRSAAYLDLKKGEADIALRLTRNPQDPDLICRKISTARFTIFGTRAYADKHGMPGSADDLDGHRFVTFRHPENSNPSHEWVAAHVAPDRIFATYGEYGLFEEAVKSGIALGMMNLRMAESDPALIPCFEPLDELNAEHLMLVAPEAWRRPEEQAFARFFAPRYAALYK